MGKRYEVTVEYGTTQPATEPAEPAEFERFTDLTRKLVAVPKSELDEKREQSK